MYGVVDGLYYCQQNRVSELNERISSRNVPSEPLPPSFSPQTSAPTANNIPDRRKFLRRIGRKSSLHPTGTGTRIVGRRSFENTTGRVDRADPWCENCRSRLPCVKRCRSGSRHRRQPRSLDGSDPLHPVCPPCRTLRMHQR